MIIKVEAELLGKIKLEREIIFKSMPYDVKVSFNEENGKFFISLKRPFYNYQSFIPTIKDRSINIPDENFLEEFKNIFQYIESFGAIDSNIDKIDWGNLIVEWIPETEDDKLSISKYSRQISDNLESVTISENWLKEIMIFRRQLNHLVMPFSYMKDGIVEYNKQNYQKSFMNFYLMIEGCFSNGKNFKNSVVKNDFANSNILDFAIKKMFMELCKGIHVSEHKWFVNECKKYNKEPFKKESLIHLLVENRGKLSHFSIRACLKIK